MAKATPSSPKPKRKGRFFRRFIRSLLLLLLLGTAALLTYWFWPMPERDIYDFVPQDACYIIEADDPIENWKAFSKTPIWKHLKKNELMADIEGDANYLDTLIMDNERIFKLLSGKKLLIVGQMYKADDYDFLYLIDLKKGAKVSFFMDVFKGIMNAAGLTMTKKELAGNTIYGIGEGSDEVLLGFQDNILVASYSNSLLLKSFKESEKPFYTRNNNFQSMRKKAFKLENDESVGKVHVNFDQLDEMMGVYMDDVTETVTGLSNSLEYAGFDLKMGGDHADFSGNLTIDDSVPSLMTVMKTIERSEIRSHQILPRYTSFLLTLNFHDFDYFYRQISELMEEDEGFQEYEKTQNQIAGLLGVRRRDKRIERKRKKGKDVDYFDWIGQEISMAMVPLDESGRKQAYVAVFHSPDKENAEHDLNAIEKKLKNRSPVRFEEYEYKGKTINYLKLKGFFKLFLGKLFTQFDKPKYAVLDEFVIFSNDTTALHRMIDVANGNLANLPMDSEYRRFYRNFEPQSNYYLYVNMPKIFPALPGFLDGSSARDLRENEALITRFRKVGLQLLSEEEHFEAKLFVDFEK
ncbi:MAG: DUF3352 domain-containing protein [Bacteroidota bacterium]